MGKCLLTQLKASVNNPDLPVLETMQQITLDAIAASGNSSMTDDQKYALNHFFYQIGAVGNTGIWTKLVALYMPLICNSNLQYALVDYKGNGDISFLPSNNVQFQSKGIIADPEGSTSAANLRVGAAAVGTTPTNLSVATVFANKFSEMVGATSLTPFKFIDKDVVAAKASSVSYVSLFGRQARYTPAVDFDVITGSIYGSGENDYLSVFKGDELYVNNALSGTVSAPSSTELLYLIWNVYNPICVYAYGTGLTQSESEKFATALKDLKLAFSTI